jgi:amino acid adenylation domain-containing protein
MDEAPSFRVSPQQEQRWTEQPDGPSGTIQAVVAVTGTVEPEQLRGALDALVERHEILRTTFVRQAGIRIPLQTIHDTLAPRWETLDLRGSREADRSARLEAALAAERGRRLDFEHGPLVSGFLATTGETTQVVALTLSALCADLASVEVLVRELVAGVAGDALPGDPLQYADFSEWQHEQMTAADDSAEAAKAFWREVSEVPATHVPLARAATAAVELDEHPLAVSADIAALLAQQAARYSATETVVVQAAWHAFLSRETGQDDVVVAVQNATPRHPDIDGAVGLLGSPVLVRTTVAAELTFAELVDQVDRALATASAHQDRWPSFATAEAPGFIVRPAVSADAGGTHFVLSRIVDSGAAAALALAYAGPSGDPAVGARPEDISLALVYDRARLDAVDVAALAGQFERLLESALEHPGARVAELDLLGDEDLRMLVTGLNETSVEREEIRVHELFARAAAATPDAVAVTDGVAELSYAELETRANQLARRLAQAGVQPGNVVGLCTDRSVQMVVGVLGILKAGAAYLPLNHEHPSARLRHQLVESEVRALVTQERLLERLPAFDHDIVCLDRDRAELDALEPSAPVEAGGLAELVYVIYTSGSTGAPKGVGVTHRNLSNYAQDLVERLGAASQAFAFGMVTAISTDLGNTALFPALCSGGTVVLVKPEIAADPAAFAARVAATPLDVLKITPSHLSALLRANDPRILPRHTLVMGGERLGWDLVDRVRGLADCQLLNHYGPTETTVGSCTLLVGDGPGPYQPTTVPIGRPISNTRCYVLDEQGRPAPLDSEGRLFIAGAGVARGYVGQPEITAERFLADPFVPAERMYDTGDRVRRLPDGTLEFRGRFDDQLKIRGFRVEPSEVEGALRSHPAVANAAVVAVEEIAGDIRLVAYYELQGAASTDELARHVAEWVPEYMVPSAFVALDALPLGSSGKVDRQALPDPAAAGRAETEAEYVAPRTEVEEAVAGIWADVLRLERVSVEADFFSLGGHSLLATQVVAQVRTDFAIELPLHSLFMYPTIALLAGEVVSLMSSAEQDETAKLLEELEELSDEQASEMADEIGGHGEAI